MPTICIPNITDEKVSIIDELAQSKGLQKSVYCRMIYKDYNYRKNSRSFYLDTVVAYKVGKIIKTAEENDIKLVYPSEKDDFIENLDGRIVDDLNKEDAG